MMSKQPTGLKRGLPPSVEPEESEIPKKHKQDRVSPPPHPPPTNHHQHTPLKNNGYLPSPLTRADTSPKETASPSTSAIPTPALDQFVTLGENSASQPVSGSQTQPFSQLIYPPHSLAYEVDDEESEGVWGYLIPVDGKSSKFGTLILRERLACPDNDSESCNEKEPVDKKGYLKQEKEIEKKKEYKTPSQGYLIGRHLECDLRINSLTVSNRHCLIFSENRDSHTVALIEDTSGNGTFINDALVGRNNRRELRDGDEVSILDEARFCFRYARHRSSSLFNQQYVILDKLGKGHFASVYLCVDKGTGSKWAVKKFDRPRDSGKLEGLHQEIAMLMSISHPALLCFKGAFDESDGIYLILELAAKGELFNLIVKRQKLTEDETRKVFIQLFQAVKYLHERNIVHRDIKPENILLADDNFSVKLADFGLAKIIGDESFTTTLCGTPSYVAPEILQPTSRRRYTKAVDVWSLGVVLYICLCGFPPFSDELYTPENPFTLPQQIIAGRYDFPSPYWDSVADPALDLIDQMLTVDSDKRISIDECLEHPWITGQDLGATQAGESLLSTDGLLAGRMNNLDFSKRKPKRERTLLSELNNIHIKKIEDANKGSVDIITKNSDNEDDGEDGSIENRFVAIGEIDDVPLFGDDESSRYASNTKGGALL